MPTGSATAGSPRALTAMAMRMARRSSATRPSSRSVPALRGNVGGDRRDDQRVVFLELTPRSQRLTAG